MPAWVQQGYEEYAKRLPRDCELILKEIAPEKRTKNSDIARIIKNESERMLLAAPVGAHAVALDSAGKHWTTLELSQTLQRWRVGGQAVAMLIGGPDGLSDALKQSARETWSLSKLTFPHPLVRILVAEQLYRAWSLLNHHPYHRA